MMSKVHLITAAKDRPAELKMKAAMRLSSIS